MPKTALSGLDLAAVVRELRELIKGSRLANIYQLSQNKFLLKLRGRGRTFRLLVELGRCAHLLGEGREVSVPERPPPFCMGLRKDLRGLLLADVRQRGLDRLLELVFSGREGAFRLVFELFGQGNLVLVGPDGRIKRVLRPRKMRDRELLPGREFRYPPSPELDISGPGELDLGRLRGLGSLEVVRGLARLTGLGGTYAEEVLARAGVEKAIPCSSLSNEELARVKEALAGLVEQVLEGSLEPRIIASGGRWLDVVPVKLMKYADLEELPFPTMNEAVEAYFSRLEAEGARESVLRELEEEVRRLEERLRLQEKALARLREEEAKCREAGDIIFARLHELNGLLKALRELRERLGDWPSVRETLGELRRRGPPFSWLVDLRPGPEGPRVLLAVDGVELALDPRAQAQEAAASYYERAKKARRKAEGAARALEETRRKLEEVRGKLARARKEELVLEVPAAREELPAPSQPPATVRRAWYERFRWFRSSDGFLVVAGKDAVTNELLVKRYAEPGDLLLHAELPGAPFVLVKAGGREVPGSTLEEAAQMAITYSRAWKYGLGAATAICFRPEQAKKVGPHGEKLPKGAFYILGRKEYVRGVRPLLAIGAVRSDGRFKLTVGPVGAVASRAAAFVLVGPGDTPARELVREAVRELEARLGPLALGGEELERAAAGIPYGRGRLLPGSRR